MMAYGTHRHDNLVVRTDWWYVCGVSVCVPRQFVEVHLQQTCRHDVES